MFHCKFPRLKKSQASIVRPGVYPLRDGHPTGSSTVPPPCHRSAPASRATVRSNGAALALDPELPGIWEYRDRSRSSPCHLSLVFSNGSWQLSIESIGAPRLTGLFVTSLERCTCRSRACKVYSLRSRGLSAAGLHCDEQMTNPFPVLD